MFDKKELSFNEININAKPVIYEKLMKTTESGKNTILEEKESFSSDTNEENRIRTPILFQKNTKEEKAVYLESEEESISSASENNRGKDFSKNKMNDNTKLINENNEDKQVLVENLHKSNSRSRINNLSTKNRKDLISKKLSLSIEAANQSDQEKNTNEQDNQFSIEKMGKMEKKIHGFLNGKNKNDDSVITRFNSCSNFSYETKYKLRESSYLTKSQIQNSIKEKDDNLKSKDYQNMTLLIFSLLEMQILSDINTNLDSANDIIKFFANFALQEISCCGKKGMNFNQYVEHYKTFHSEAKTSFLKRTMSEDIDNSIFKTGFFKNKFSDLDKKGDLNFISNNNTGKIINFEKKHSDDSRLIDEQTCKFDNNSRFSSFKLKKTPNFNDISGISRSSKFACKNSSIDKCRGFLFKAPLYTEKKNFNEKNKNRDNENYASIPFRCKTDLCKKKFKSESGSKYHINNEHGRLVEHETKKFFCVHSGCTKRYKNYNGLKYHLKHNHLD
ncbi:hypothetical protein EDEG_02042 [Edhazardia aedis USNM 41457]|uniref:C2H2-type domain-containing protein n=1 Tax=Edhazardia aedis (strain USNM 41457) TaxID=1003232 RepID=J9DM29_EDHAE|nr:hypothetical protein EDEG_02042 [Edhazardia aedis USNM 41457]|eukprot:EJW03645.1 hypothetical protein EDEG_02042 [Edhazardia aedis USNM 41457]